MRAYTHTLQMVSEELAIPIEEANQRPYLTKNISRVQRGILYPINANKFVHRDIESYEELVSVLDLIKQDLEVDEWFIDRQDIAVDTTASYDELYKINRMLVLLFGLHTNNKNVTSIEGIRELKKRALVCHDRKYELYIYDKRLESGGKYPYSRCEFRFKLLDANHRNKVLQELCKMLRVLPKHLDELNKLKIDTLYKLWLTESAPDYKNTPVHSLPEFFRRHGDDIFTTNIARGLHDKILKGKYENWIGHYRQSGGNIHFIRKTEIKNYCNSIKKAVENYAKSCG